jgi:hypothetical protein
MLPKTPRKSPHNTALSGIARWPLPVLCLLALLSCGGQPFILVDIDSTAVAGGFSKLLLRTQLNGVYGQDMTFPSTEQRIVVYLPDGASGTVQLELDGLDGNGCKVAQAQLTTDVPGGPTDAAERSVMLAPLAMPLCTISVVIDGGTGSVTSMPAGLACASSSSAGCSADFAAGTLLKLSAATGARSYTAWSDGCSGLTSSCALTVSKAQTVHIGFGDRQCSPDGWCWENPLPLGGTLQSLAGIDANSVAVFGDSTVMRCRGAACSSLATLPAISVTAAWALDAENIYATGAVGLVRCAASSGTCTSLTAGSGSPYAVWGSDAANVYIAGLMGFVARCSAGSTSCAVLSSGTTQSFFSIWGSDAANVYVGGANGTLLRCAAGSGSCAPLTTGTTQSLSAIWGSDASNLNGVYGSTHIRSLPTTGRRWNHEGSIRSAGRHAVSVRSAA